MNKEAFVVLDLAFFLGVVCIAVDVVTLLFGKPSTLLQSGFGWGGTAVRFLFRNRLSRAVYVLARDGIILCATLALVGRVSFGLPADVLFRRYSTAFPALVSSVIHGMTGSESHREQAADDEEGQATEAIVMSVFQSGSRYYVGSIRSPATIEPNASDDSSATVILGYNKLFTQNFSFPSTCTLEGLTRCDLRPEPPQLSGVHTSDLVEQHVFLKKPVPPGVAVLDVYDPTKNHRVVIGAREAVENSASELGKLCRLVFPANLPPGKGLFGEGNDIDNLLRTTLCVFADFGGVFLEARAGLQREGTPVQRYIDGVKETEASYSYYYRRRYR